MCTDQSTVTKSRATTHVRERLLTALHMARLQPGERIPSVRRMAQMTGLDRKTIHRAYVQLEHEGMLLARPGSGTYLAPVPAAGAGTLDPAAVLAGVSQCLAAARALGLPPALFARFLELFAAAALPEVRILVTECNGEQLGLIAREVATALGATVSPVLVQDLASAPEALGSCHAVVTTDCHRDEVSRIVGTLGVPVLRVALNPEHAQMLLRHARQGPVVMVVRDLRYEGAFRRLMVRLGVPAAIADRVQFTEPFGLERRLRQVDGPGALYVSPLVAADVRWALPHGWRRIVGPRYTDETSVDVLRAQLALAAARAESAPPPAARVPWRRPVRRQGQTGLSAASRPLPYVETHPAPLPARTR